MICWPGGAALFSSAKASGSVVASPDGSPVTKHTARPSCAVTWVPQALLRPAALVVPALADRLGAGVGHEVAGGGLGMPFSIAATTGLVTPAILAKINNIRIIFCRREPQARWPVVHLLPEIWGQGGSQNRRRQMRAGARQHAKPLAGHRQRQPAPPQPHAPATNSSRPVQVQRRAPQRPHRSQVPRQPQIVPARPLPQVRVSNPDFDQRPDLR